MFGDCELKKAAKDIDDRFRNTAPRAVNSTLAVRTPRWDGTQQSPFGAPRTGTALIVGHNQLLFVATVVTPILFALWNTHL